MSKLRELLPRPTKQRPTAKSGRKPPYAWLPRVLVSQLPNLSGAAAKVAIAIGAHIWGDGGMCYASIATIGQAIGTKRRATIVAALKELKAAGLIVGVRRYRRPSGYSWGTGIKVTPCETSTLQAEAKVIVPVSESQSSVFGESKFHTGLQESTPLTCSVERTTSEAFSKPTVGEATRAEKPPAKTTGGQTAQKREEPTPDQKLAAQICPGAWAAVTLGRKLAASERRMIVEAVNQDAGHDIARTDPVKALDGALAPTSDLVRFWRGGR
jgi:hypothetical protein